MSLKIFLEISDLMRFDNLSTREERRLSDKLAGLKDNREMLNQQLSTQYTPGAYLTVDEQLVPCRANCPFRQYMKSKPAKYGIKIWWTIDNETWYSLNGHVYLVKLPDGGR